MRIAIIAEGRTEKAFKASLDEFWAQRGIRKKPTVRFVPSNGRINKGEKLQKEVANLLSGRTAFDHVVVLTDVHTGYNDFTDAEDARRKLRNWVGDNERFHPHAAQFEFEAWLLPYWDKIQDLTKTTKAKPAYPENLPKPSLLLEEVFKARSSTDSYNKPIHAVKILKGQDLQVAADECPSLKAFLNTLLKICKSKQL